MLSVYQGGNVTDGSENRRDPVAYSRSIQAPPTMRGTENTNLADLLERVLDKGIVIAGDVRLYLGGIELLTLKIRLLIASVDKAQEIGINWWESDPALSSQNRELRQQRDELLRRLARIEEQTPGLDVGSETEWGDFSEPALAAQNRELRQQRDEMRERLDKLESRLTAHVRETEEGEESKPQRGRKRR
jgi:hypothetical protein